MTVTTEPDGDHRWRIGFWLLAGSEFAVAGFDISQGDWWGAITFGIYGLLFLQWPHMRQQWIKIGYGRGRAAMLRSAGEAFGRGMAPHEWALAELERDVVDLAPKRKR